MALYVRFADGNEIVWHYGRTPKGETQSLRELARDNAVSSVQADGHELLYIIRCWKNIPVNESREVNVWFNEVARFIAANL